MRVFITGATGYIGRAVAEELVRRGHSVTGLVRSDSSAAKLSPGVSPLRGSLANPQDWVAAAASHDAIVHCALDHGLAATASYTAALEQESAALQQMLDAALAGATRVMVVTTDLGAVSSGDCDETARPEPVDPSQKVRHEFEARLLAANCDRLRTCAIRPAWVYGGPAHCGIVDTIEEASAGGPPRVVGDGEGEVSLVALADLARLYARLVEDSNCAGAFHACPEGNRMTWARIAQRVSELSGFGGKIVRVPLDRAAEEMGFLAAIMEPLVARTKRCNEIGFHFTEPHLDDAFERFYKECHP